jgi:excisionase family DNA binding protein
MVKKPKRSPTGEPPTLLTSAEVADLLRVHPKHVYRLLRDGLPAHRVGSEWRFVRDEVLDWSSRRGPLGARIEHAVAATRELGVAPPLIAANGDVSVELVLGALLHRGAVLGFVQADRDGALELLARRKVLAAGTHGVTPPTDLAGERLVQLHLVNREVGLVYAQGAKVRSLADLSKKVRFASRPPSAGVRAHLDAALREAGHDPVAVHERAMQLDSHRDVVCAVLRGDADLGLASAAWAARVGLAFAKITSEPYGLTLFAQDLGDPRVVQLCEVSQSAALRTALAAIAGYDATYSGSIRYEPVA